MCACGSNALLHVGRLMVDKMSGNICPLMERSFKLVVIRYISRIGIRSKSVAISISLENKEAGDKDIAIFRKFTAGGDL